MHKLLRLTFLAAILLVVGCGTPDPSLQLPSSVIWVAPQDNPNESTVFATINAAVQAANGRLIKVRAGTYKESVNVPASATIRLEGESDGLVILIPPDEKPAWSLGEKSDVQVSNLQIEAGLRGFVVAAGSSLSLKNIKINNVVGQAVFSQQATISLLNVSIKNVKRPSEAQFDKIGQGQAVRVEGGKLVVDGCTFEKTANRGVNVLKQGIATISDSTFVGEKNPKCSSHRLPRVPRNRHSRHAQAMERGDLPAQRKYHDGGLDHRRLRRKWSPDLGFKLVPLAKQHHQELREERTFLVQQQRSLAQQHHRWFAGVRDFPLPESSSSPSPGGEQHGDKQQGCWDSSVQHQRNHCG